MTRERFEEQYLRLYAKSIRWAGKYGAKDPEEVAQNAWAKAWAAIDTLRNPTYFETWIFRIIHNETMISHRRRVRQAQVLSLDAELLDSLSDKQQLHNEQLETMVDWLIEQIGLLPSIYREILMLRLEGMCHDQLSEHLQIKIPAIKSRLLRATRMLRENIS